MVSCRTDARPIHLDVPVTARVLPTDACVRHAASSCDVLVRQWIAPGCLLASAAEPREEEDEQGDHDRDNSSVLHVRRIALGRESEWLLVVCCSLADGLVVAARTREAHRHLAAGGSALA